MRAAETDDILAIASVKDPNSIAVTLFRALEATNIEFIYYRIKDQLEARNNHWGVRCCIEYGDIDLARRLFWDSLIIGDDKACLKAVVNLLPFADMSSGEEEAVNSRICGTI